MHHAGDTPGQMPLRPACCGVLEVLRHQHGDVGEAVEREPLQKLLHRRIVVLHPKLTEGERAGLGWVEPDRTLGRLAELRAALPQEQGVAEPVGLRRRPILPPFSASDQLGAGGDVPPLIGTPHLQLDAVKLAQHQEVVALEQHVAELGEGETTLESRLDTLLRKHVADGEMLSRVTEELDEPEVAKPREVVEQERTVRTAQVDEVRQLGTDRGAVPIERLSIEQVALRRATGRIADHPRPAADQRNGATAVQLQTSQRKDTHEVADMEGIGTRIEADVGTDRGSGGETLIEARSCVVDEPTIGKVAKQR